MISIIIPLGTGSKWGNNELRYMLRSLEMFAEFDYNVTIYSTKQISWIQNANVKIVNRWYPETAKKYYGGTKHYENYFDVLNKLKTASYDDDLSSMVLYTYDDVLWLKKTYIQEIGLVIAADRFQDRPEFWLNPKNNKWKTTILDAIKKSKGFNIDPHIYETHLPRLYERKSIQELFKKFPFENLKVPYAFATLYYNYFHHKPDLNYKHNNKIKTGFYGGKTKTVDVYSSKSHKHINKAVEGKQYINYNDAGLSPQLKEWIQQKFPNKSKFEK